VRACFCCDIAEVSLLSWLLLVRSAGGVESLMNIAGGYQDSQFDGGVGQVPAAIAAELGEAVVLDAPVTAVVQHADRVEVTASGTRVTARRAILALPRALAAGIRFDPALPPDHALLIHQMPAGTEVKTVVVYDEPFWRADGVSGASVATDDPIEITLDTTQPGHAQGVIGTYSAGPRARASSHSTGAACASRSVGCIGPAPRRRRSRSVPWMARCVPASGSATKSCEPPPDPLGTHPLGSRPGSRPHAELLAEERQRLVQRGAGRRARIIHQMFGQHGVCLLRVAVGIARSGVDLHCDELVAELAPQRLEAFGEAEGVVGEPQAEQARPR